MRMIDGLEIIAHKHMESTISVCGDIDPYVVFYKNPQGEVFYVDNPGIEDYDRPVKYKGSMSADDLKNFVPKMDYAGVKGLLR